MPENPKCTIPDCKGETMVRRNTTSSLKSTQWHFRCPKCQPNPRKGNYVIGPDKRPYRKLRFDVKPLSPIPGIGHRPHVHRVPSPRNAFPNQRDQRISGARRDGIPTAYRLRTAPSICVCGGAAGAIRDRAVRSSCSLRPVRQTTLLPTCRASACETGLPECGNSANLA